MLLCYCAQILCWMYFSAWYSLCCFWRFVYELFNARINLLLFYDILFMWVDVCSKIVLWLILYEFHFVLVGLLRHEGTLQNMDLFFTRALLEKPIQRIKEEFHEIWQISARLLQELIALQVIFMALSFYILLKCSAIE